MHARRGQRPDQQLEVNTTNQRYLDMEVLLARTVAAFSGARNLLTARATTAGGKAMSGYSGYQ